MTCVPWPVAGEEAGKSGCRSREFQFVNCWYTPGVFVKIEPEGYPTPRCFCKRVRNCLKINELSFWRTQESS
jgi:hypothetical protein